MLHACEGTFTCQGKPLEVVHSYKYLGLQVTVSHHLLRDLATQQVAKFTQAALRLRQTTYQLRIVAPGVRTQLAQSLCISHLLYAAPVWAPALPVLPTLRPPRSHHVAHPMQLAFSALLRWALDLPQTTRLELLHILANLPPPATLISK